MAALHVAGGQFPLPTSVVAKSRVAEDGDAALLRPLQDPVGAVEILGRNLTSNSRLMWAIAACLAAVALSGRRAAGVRTAAIAVLVAFVGQSWYGFTFTRYGEWLVASGVVVAALALATLDGRQPGRRRAWTIWTAAALALALGQVTATEDSTDAASSVHRQQEQMGRFLERYYPDQGAGVNDLGFVAWRHGGPLVDFLGLGSVDITRSRRDHDGVLLVEEMERIAEESGVEVVAVYRDPDRFFTRGLPDSWEPVLDWCLEGSTGVAGDRCVTWFATAEGDAEELAANLEDFEASLPPGVTTEPADP